MFSYTTYINAAYFNASLKFYGDIMTSQNPSLVTRLAIFAIASTTVLGPTIIAPSLPELEAHFASTPHADMLSKLILTLPALSIMIFSPLAGFVYAAYKRLPVIFAALLLWSVAAMECGWGKWLYAR